MPPPTRRPPRLHPAAPPRHSAAQSAGRGSPRPPASTATSGPSTEPVLNPTGRSGSPDLIWNQKRDTRASRAQEKLSKNQTGSRPENRTRKILRPAARSDPETRHHERDTTRSESRRSSPQPSRDENKTKQSTDGGGTDFRQAFTLKYNRKFDLVPFSEHCFVIQSLQTTKCPAQFQSDVFKHFIVQNLEIQFTGYETETLIND